MSEQREFPDWEQLYQEQPVESMPWFNPDLDPDLEQALIQLDIHQGTVLDLGTGPGTQAIALAERGFQVTASDLSVSAIQQAEVKAAAKGVPVTFVQDDILNTQLTPGFDFVLDRGCFHVLPPDRRQDYRHTLSRLIKPGGYLLLKCFSHLEQRPEGPYRFTPEEIQQMFGPNFAVASITETAYFGTLDPPPQALFCVLVNRKPG